MAYVYGIRVDGVLRYIGKGTARGGKLSRFHDHMRAMRRFIRHRIEGMEPPSDPHSQISLPLAHAYLDGAEIGEVILLDGLTDEAAYEAEKKLIAANRSTLWNKTEGGRINSETARAGGKALVGKPRSKVCREKQSSSLKDYWANPDNKEKHRAALRGVPKTRRVSNVIKFKE